jgi:hypothetical protein
MYIVKDVEAKFGSTHSNDRSHKLDEEIRELEQGRIKMVKEINK